MFGFGSWKTESQIIERVIRTNSILKGCSFYKTKDMGVNYTCDVVNGVISNRWINLIGRYGELSIMVSDNSLIVSIVCNGKIDYDNIYSKLNWYREMVSKDVSDYGIYYVDLDEIGESITMTITEADDVDVNNLEEKINRIFTTLEKFVFN